MKRILSLALCLILVFSLCACGEKPAKSTDEPIIGRWLYRAHAFIQVLTFTEDTIERKYMTFEPEKASYKVNSVTIEGETSLYSLAVTEGDFTYDTEITVTGDTLVWEGLDYRRLAEDEEVDYNFTEEEVQDMLFSGNEMVKVDPETGNPIEEEDEPDKEDETPDTKPTETPVSTDDPLVGLWRHEDGDFVLEFNFTDGKKYEYYKGDYSFYTTYKIISVIDNGDGTTTVQIEENDEDLIIHVKIVLEGNTLKYGEDEILFIKQD